MDPEAMPLTWRRGRVVAVSPDGAEVWLFGGPGPVRLAGRDSGPLAQAVDGVRDRDALIARAEDAGMPVDDARRIVGKWIAAGHLVGIEKAGRPALGLACRNDRIAQALELAGVEVSAESDLEVVVVDDLLDVADLCIDRPTISVQLRGPRALVSPVLGPGGACPACLVSRIRNRRSVEFIAASRAGLDRPPPSPIAHTEAVPVAAGLVAAVAARPRDLGAAQVLVIDAASAAVTAQRLVPVAACARCDPDGSTVQMAHLNGPPSTHEGNAVETAGGLRVVDPDVTWQQYRHLIGDVVGIVPEVRQTGDARMRAYSAGMNVAAVDDLMVLKSRLRAGAGGKGTTLAAARAGALAEALERDSMRARGNEPHCRAVMADLPGAIHPNDIQLFSQAQLLRAQQLLALGIEDPATTGFHRVPLPFDVEAEHDWSPVADMVTGQTHWLPSALVWLGWPGTPKGYPRGCSNGAAAGNTLKEALLQGLLELVERDSVALWWHPRCLRPAIDIEASTDPRIEAALAPQRAFGTDVQVLDVTTDLGIPAAVAVASGIEALGSAPLMGYGAHLDPVIAVVRALTELAQMQAPFAGKPADMALEFPGQAEKDWFGQVTTDSEPWLAGHGSVPLAQGPGHESVDDALDDLIDRLTSRDLQILWADLTRPDIGLPVVRTFVPGLRHFWRRTGPGRIYDVPPRLGWRDGGYTQADLNPWAMIL